MRLAMKCSPWKEICTSNNAPVSECCTFPSRKMVRCGNRSRAGRVRVQRDLRVPGHPEIFVIGDTASLDQDGKPLPGVAQVAMQQGRYVGKLIRRQVVGKDGLKPFR